MKAIRVHQFGGPDVLRLEDVSTPSPGGGQVLVAVHAVGVNPVDTYIRSGTYARKPALPYTPGTDAAGVVESVGQGVTRVRTGQRVFVSATLDTSFSGSYAQEALCGEAFVHPLPDHLSFAQGAAVGVPYVTAYRALFHKAHARAGETVLVHGGSGGVGLASIQLARALGLTVFATAGSDRGRALVEAQGAHHVLNHTEAGYLDQLVKATDGRGVDLVLEMLANVNLGADLTVLAPRGRVIVIGSRGDVQITPRNLMARDASVTGLTIWNTPFDELVSLHAGLVAGLANKTLNPVVGREMPLVDAPKAHEAVMAPGAYGKIVLVP